MLTPNYPSSAQAPLQPQDLAQQRNKVACSDCNLRELCIPSGLKREEQLLLDGLVVMRQKVKRGAALFRTGDKFRALYAVHAGFFKTSTTSENGESQASGFQMSGEIIGLDGIAQDQYTCDAIALEDSQVCVMPFKRLKEVSHQMRALQHGIYKIMGQEILREKQTLLMLRSTRAEERVAAFLLKLAQQLHARGCSKSEFFLRMTRSELASYLGLKLETVSRTFSKFVAQGLIEVKLNHVRILQAPELARMVQMR